jgi:hypothetical protein
VRQGKVDGSCGSERHGFDHNRDLDRKGTAPGQIFLDRIGAMSQTQQNASRSVGCEPQKKIVQKGPVPDWSENLG